MAVSTNNDVKVLRELPKTEIHLHLEGLASVETLWSLIQKRNLDVGIKSRQELNERFRIHNLNEFIDLFINVIQNCIQSDEDLDYLITDAHNYLRDNNVRYAEIFYSPTKLMQNGIKYPDIVTRLTEGVKRIKEQSGIVIRYITDVSRSFGIKNARFNMNNHLKYGSYAFIGIGLGGAEQKHSARQFRDVFKVASAQGCNLVAHAGEDCGPSSIWDALRYLNVQRIGHGISAVQDEKLIHYLRETQVALEVCPTSNLYTGKYAQSLSAHPIRYFFDQGLNVTLNSDDPTLFNTGINSEYCKLLESGIFNVQELVRIAKNGIYATFLPQDEKDELWMRAKRYLTKEHYAHVIT